MQLRFLGWQYVRSFLSTCLGQAGQVWLNSICAAPQNHLLLDASLCVLRDCIAFAPISDHVHYAVRRQSYCSLQTPFTTEMCIAGIPGGVLCAQSMTAKKEGRTYIVTAIVFGQPSGEASLDGTFLHWGCSGSNRQSWQPPPHGWHTTPPISRPAGRRLCTPCSKTFL